jgi:hypothetical protein
MNKTVKLSTLKFLFGCVLLMTTSCNANSRQSFIQQDGFDKFIKDADTSDIRENREIGFGARRVFMQNRGYWITAVGFENRIIALNVNCSGSSPDAPVEVSVKRAILNASLPDAGNKLCYYDYVDKEGLAHLQSAITAKLGEQKEEKAETDEIARAYQTLMSPFEHLTFGKMCWEGAEKPNGRREMEKLVQADRIDLLRNALRSANPEGRVYAAEGLLALAQHTGKPLEPSDKTAIDEIRDSPVLIEACSGCMPENKTVDQLLS